MPAWQSDRPWAPSEPVTPAGAIRIPQKGSHFDVTVDPAAGIKGMPPNMGDGIMPHALTFQGIASSQAHVYRPSDEALRDSYANARFMRNDPIIMEPLEIRQRAVALLDWHIEVDDEKDPEQTALAKTLTKILEKIPRFMQYREVLLNAAWFGKYGIQHRWQWRMLNDEMRLLPNKWLPIHGDKIVFRYDDGLGTHRPDQIGIRMGYGYATGKAAKFNVDQMRKVESTDYGLAYFLDTWERPLVALHKYRIEDGEYEEPFNAGRLHGVGIRSVLYWAWYQKQETLAFLMEYLERSAAGIEIWYYPMGNPQAEQKVRKAAEERIGLGRNVVMVPRPMGEDAPYYDVQRIEPGMAGADQLKSIVIEYFGHTIKRYILGQTLTTEASATGLGSNLADIHKDTFMQIVRYEATLLEETLTSDLLMPLVRFNFPKYANLPLQFRVDTEAHDAEAKLEALLKAYDMGLRLDAQQVRDLIGAPKPEAQAEVLDKLEQMKAQLELQQQYQPQGGEGEEGMGDLDMPEPKNSNSVGGASAMAPAEYEASETPSEDAERVPLVESDAPRPHAGNGLASAVRDELLRRLAA